MYSKCLCTRSKCACTIPDETAALEFYRKFALDQGIKQSANFLGVAESHLLLLEKQFHIAIIVMELEESEIAQCTCASGKTGDKKM